MASGTAMIALALSIGSAVSQTRKDPPKQAAATGAEPLSNGMPYSKVVEYSISPTKLPTADAASVPRQGEHPDFSGFWLQDQGILFSDPTPKHHSGSHPGYDDTINPIPFTPEYAARYAAFNAKVKKDGYNRIYDCDPTGMPRIMSNPFPMELILTPQKLVALFEYKSQMRRAYLDGRAMPSEDDYTPSYMGFTTGKWEGETLVTETGLIGQFDGKLIQITGIEHSDKLKIVERIRFLNKDRLEWEIAMIDPVVFAKPFVSRRSFTRQPADYNVPEYECSTGELIGELGLVKGPKAAEPKK